MHQSRQEIHNCACILENLIFMRKEIGKSESSKRGYPLILITSDEELTADFFERSYDLIEVHMCILEAAWVKKAFFYV